MSERGLPPYPASDDWRQWATQLVEYLLNEARSEEFVAPRTVALLHQVPPLTYKTVQNGLLMYDPLIGYPVFSYEDDWLSLGSAYNISNNFNVTWDGPVDRIMYWKDDNDAYSSAEIKYYG